MILSGRLDQGAALAQTLASEFPDAGSHHADAASVQWLQARSLPQGEPEAWVEAWEALPPSGTAEMETALRVALARGLAQASELRDGKGGFVGQEPVGAYLVRAGLHQDAAASLFASLAKTPRSGRAALHLGNALSHLDRPDEARDCYRRALRVAPLELELEEIADLEVRGLAAGAEGLGLEGDVRPWIPILGFLEDVLPLSALDPVPGAGFGAATRAYDLLIAHKGARSHGERLAIRRDLQLLVPTLFVALVEARKLDAAPAPVGNA